MALEETMPENQKSLFLILSRWLHCKASRTADILQRQLCHKTQHVYNLANRVFIGNTVFSSKEVALILLLHAVITRVVMLSV